MNKLEKIKKLEEVLAQLKSEFVGLDSIIDELGTMFNPWYISREVLKRPTVISLWGMSGVGKTSLIKRMVELLDLSNKTLTFDCGVDSGDSGSRTLCDKLSNYFNNSDLDVKLDTSDTIFIFDEFQHARFIGSDGEDVRNQALQPVFSLIDSGILELTDESDWSLNSLVNFVGDLKELLAAKPSISDVAVRRGVIYKEEEVKAFLEDKGFGLFYYDRELSVGGKGTTPNPQKVSRRSSKKKDDEENPYRPLTLLDDSTIKAGLRKLKKVEDISNVREFSDNYYGATSVGQIYTLLTELLNKVYLPEKIDCSKSLVFILGNLDECFRVSDDLSPDIDADVFYKETSRVTVNDIKDALKTRFRPEQIARFGNSIIKYPTLKKEHFVTIIKNEVDRMCREFNKEYNVTVSTTERFRGLLYSESVYPTQGVRPVLSSISSLFAPLLSKIYMEISEQPAGMNVVVDVVEDDFKTEQVTVKITYTTKDGKSKVENHPFKLILGASRKPTSRGTRYINGIHEAGHAIIFSYLYGILPLSIVAVSTDHGGFCVTFDENRLGEIDTFRSVENDLAVDMGGWCAEELVFPEKVRLLGSSSDIASAWTTVTMAFYEQGLGDFMRFAVDKTNDMNGLPLGKFDKESEDFCKKKIDEYFNNVKKLTKKILEENKKLLLITGKELGEKGGISSEEFLELIREHGNTLTEKRMSDAREENSMDIYEKCIDQELKKLG